MDQGLDQVKMKRRFSKEDFQEDLSHVCKF